MSALSLHCFPTTQILEGLEYMHSKSIGHLGLTPCDVLFTRPGGSEVKIADFSLSRRIVGNVKLDYGQPEFVAPEVVNGEGAGFGSDMWSVGVMTYLLLSGVSPFRGQVWMAWNTPSSESVAWMNNPRRTFAGIC